MFSLLGSGFWVVSFRGVLVYSSPLLVASDPPTEALARPQRDGARAGTAPGATAAANDRRPRRKTVTGGEGLGRNHHGVTVFPSLPKFGKVEELPEKRTPFWGGLVVPCCARWKLHPSSLRRVGRRVGSNWWLLLHCPYPKGSMYTPKDRSNG